MQSYCVLSKVVKRTDIVVNKPDLVLPLSFNERTNHFLTSRTHLSMEQISELIWVHALLPLILSILLHSTSKQSLADESEAVHETFLLHSLDKNENMATVHNDRLQKL